MTPHLFRTLLAPRLRVACVACGERHTVFALEDGRVAACGMNEYGQVGGDSSDCVVVPRFVDGLSHVSKVACGANHCLALTGEGVLFQWGFGSACGNFSGNILRPEEVMSSPSPVRAMAAGSSHCLLLTAPHRNPTGNRRRLREDDSDGTSQTGRPRHDVPSCFNFE
ncbi:unnamed protein product [Gadus morhua 'NCC']